MMSRFIKYQRFRIGSILFTGFFLAYALLNPEMISTGCHERIFHKPGAEIRHSHADFSFHAWFKHAAGASSSPLWLKSKPSIVVTILSLNTNHENAVVFALLALLFSIAAITVFIRRFVFRPVRCVFARGPPAFFCE